MLQTKEITLKLISEDGKLTCHPSVSIDSRYYFNIADVKIIVWEHSSGIPTVKRAEIKLVDIEKLVYFLHDIKIAITNEMIACKESNPDLFKGDLDDD